MSVCTCAVIVLLLSTVLPAAPAATSHVRILAIGDSLTEGLTNHASSFHPYSLRLQERLEKVVNVTVDQRGISGEQVLVTMRNRLFAILDDASAAGQLYDWVLLLGGINDIFQHARPEDIVLALAAMYDASIRHEARVLAMTCMENNREEDAPSLREGRLKLNSLMVKKVEERPQVQLLDLATLLPYHSMPPEEKELIWDDGVHPTPAGYDHMADIIYDALKPSLVPS